MAIVKGFFSSPFSVNHANLQVLETHLCFSTKLQILATLPLFCLEPSSGSATGRFWKATATQRPCKGPPSFKSHSGASRLCSLHRQTSPSSSSCCSPPSGSTTATGSSRLRRPTSRVALRHSLMSVSVGAAVQSPSRDVSDVLTTQIHPMQTHSELRLFHSRVIQSGVK